MKYTIKEAKEVIREHAKGAYIFESTLIAIIKDLVERVEELERLLSVTDESWQELHAKINELESEIKRLKNVP